MGAKKDTFKCCGLEPARAVVELGGSPVDSIDSISFSH